MNYRLVLSLLVITSSEILCRVLNDNEVKVILPTDFKPEKEAFFFQRQLIILLVPSALGGGVGGVPIGGLPYGSPGSGLRGTRIQNLERLRALRRRTRIRNRSTTPSFENQDDSK